MPRLTNFTVYSKFPAIARSGTNISVANLSVPSATLNPFEFVERSTSISVSSGDILSCVISANGKTVPAPYYFWTDPVKTVRCSVRVERNSPTTATIIASAYNADFSNPVTSDAFSVSVSVKAFRVP